MTVDLLEILAMDAGFASNRFEQSTTIDVYTSGITALYTPPIKKPWEGGGFGPVPTYGGLAPLKPITSDFFGSQGKSFGKVNYVKQFPKGDKLSVHAPNGYITGAKYNDKPISNYEAAMHDLRKGVVKKNTGGEW